MSQPRRAKKIDANQRAIVKALRALPGITVKTDVDDILVGFNYLNFLFEIKAQSACRPNGDVRPSRIKPSQMKMMKDWTGQYNIVTTIDEILDIIGYS